MKSTVNLFVGMSLSLTLAACSRSSENSSSQKPLPKTQVEVSKGDLSQQCIESVCGDRDPLVHPFETTTGLEKESNAQIDQTLKRPLEVYMGRIIHMQLLLDGIYKKMFQNKNQISLSPDKIGLVQSIRYLQNVGQYSSAMVPNDRGVYVLDAQKLQNLLGPGREKEVQALMSLNEILAFSQSAANLFQSPLEVILNIFYPEVPYSTAIQAEAQKIQEVENKLYAIVPALSSLKTESFVLKRAQSGKVLSVGEQIEFRKAMQRRISTSAVLAPEVQKAFSEIPLDVPAFMTEFEKQYASGKIGKIMAHPQGLKGLLNTAVQTCKTKLSYSYAALPTQAQIQTFQGIVAQLQGSAQQMMEEKMNASLPNPFRLDVVYPEARDKMLNSWVSALQDQTNRSEASLQFLKNLQVNRDTLAAIAVFAATQSPDEELFSDVFAFCDQAYSPKLNDAAYYSAKIINLSWPTIVHPEKGIGIVAHEIGHLVSRALPENLLKGEKACLTATQGTTQYLEEDFADLFSAELVKRLNYQVANVKASNFACALQPRKDQVWASAGLNNKDATDSHSSGLYRLMAVSQMTTGISSECTQYLKSSGDNRFQSYCRWEK